MVTSVEIATSSSVQSILDNVFKLKPELQVGESKKLAQKLGEIDFHEYMGLDNQFYQILKKKAADNKKVDNRISVPIILRSIYNSFGKDAEPYLVPYLGILLDLCGDKNNEVSKNASGVVQSIFDQIDKYAVAFFTPTMLSFITEHDKRGRSKLMALQFFIQASKRSPSQVCRLLPDILPVVTNAVNDTTVEIQKAAIGAMDAITGTIDNIDIVPFIPHLVKSIIDPSQSSECIYQLASTTFVTEVEAPTLAIMTPLLERALSTGQTAVQRQASIIIENMCKLVEDPTSTHTFLAQIKGKLDRVMESASNPELRTVAARANEIVERLLGGDVEFELPSQTVERLEKEENNILNHIQKSVADAGGKPLNSAALKFLGSQVSSMYRSHKFDLAEWIDVILTRLSPFIGDDGKIRDIADKLMLHYRKIYLENCKVGSREQEEEGVEICNCEFSVAYGGMILLNNTKLRLLRGKAYALVGPNGAGKSTLMKSIANGQLEGFPPQDILKTVFVEHNMQAEDADIPVVDFIFTRSEKLRSEKEDVLKILDEFGFKDEYLNHPVGALSGGWKMKLELARAMMEHAHILLLDEPTNHLDVKNVQWLIDYIKRATNVTFLIVSHDSSFIDSVCTNIIHFENRKLKTYKGNLSLFVQSHPEARSYYDLESTAFKFTFPEPGFLDGVKSKDKAILKMLNVSFTYPTKSEPAVKNISVQVSLNSRVAAIGPNGAGKSTIVKLLTGELVPTEGEIWKHPNLRVAYVAQHAFHHVEMHLDKTPNEYVRWRYANGEDKESLVKAARQLTEEEEELIKKPLGIEGEKRYFEDIVGRRKVKRSFEYEIKWINHPHDNNTWHPRVRIEEWGFSKLLQHFDERESSKEGMYARPLTAASVTKHFEDIGLDSEFSTHNRIRGLSGGQKVKVVLGSAMWNNPHILVLDEPTNYLDRDSLGALAHAIKEFGGGVVIISHNREFTKNVCPEVWNVSNGVLEIEGGKKPAIQEKIVMKEQEEMIDAFGNVVKLKSTRKLTRKELKQKEKRRQMKLKNGEPISSSDEDY